MKILITNTIVLNSGDAAILFGQLAILRQTFGNDTEFVIYAREPDVVARYYPELTLRRWLYSSVVRGRNSKHLRRLRRCFNAVRIYTAAWCLGRNVRFIAQGLLKKDELARAYDYATADLIIYNGGTSLVENYNLSPHIFDSKFSLYIRRPLSFFTMSLGPFRDFKIRSSLRKIFRDSLLIFVRGRQSIRHLEDLELDMKMVYTVPDAAFALADPGTLKQAIHRKLPSTSGPSVAISVRDWDYFVKTEKLQGMINYKRAMRAGVEYLVKEHHAQITFLSTCQGVPEYWKDDSKVACEIVDTLPDSIRESVKVSRNFHSPEELIGLLKSFDIAITTRMHMAILSLVAGTPVLPIAYEFKTREVFDRLGQGNIVQDIEEISEESLISSIRSFIQSVDDTRQQLFTRVESERQNAVQSGLLLKHVFQKHKYKKKQIWRYCTHVNRSIFNL